MSGAAESGTPGTPAQRLLSSPVADWLQVAPSGKPGEWRLAFDLRHTGNPLIRSVHGGVVASLIDMTAELALEEHLAGAMRAELVSSSIEYLRVTRDSDIFSTATITRIGRRIAFVDVRCWQDGPDTPVARGSCTLRLHPVQDA
jgi:uncharacterized protein (TIGR00369 family)